MLGGQQSSLPRLSHWELRAWSTLEPDQTLDAAAEREVFTGVQQALWKHYSKGVAPGRFSAGRMPRSKPCLPLPPLLPAQPMEVFVDDETKLTLHGLQQYYVKLKDSEKNRKLFDLLDVLEFNQVMLPHSCGLSWGSKRLGGILALTAAPSLTGGDICEVGAALHGLGPAPCGAELPSHCHPQGHGPGGAVSARHPQSPRQAPWRGTPPRIPVSDGRPLFLLRPACHVISSLRTSSGGFWWPPICLAEEWTLSVSTLSSIMTCPRTQTPTSTA